MKLFVRPFYPLLNAYYFVDVHFTMLQATHPKVEDLPTDLTVPLSGVAEPLRTGIGDAASRYLPHLLQLLPCRWYHRTD